MSQALHADKPLSVVFDGHIFAHQAVGGVSRYVVELARALPGQGIVPTVVAPLHVGRLLATLPPGTVRGVRLPDGRWTRRVAAHAQPPLRRPLAPHADVVHESWYGRRLAGRGVPIVTTIHDMAQERLDSEANARVIAAKRASLARADAVVCVSASTARDLLDIYPDVAGRTSVVHHGLTPLPAVAPHRAARPYLLFVGHRARYKNFAALAAALPRTRFWRDGGLLVCVGGGEFDDGERRLLAELGIAARVTRSDADDAGLAALYGGAQALVYPSLFEGFGLPAIEAMSRDCPVICARATSLPEICADAAEYAGSATAEEIAVAIDRLLDSASRRAALIAAGAVRARHFTWDRCARETARVYRALVPESRS